MSVQQLEALVDYLERQTELAFGRCSRSKEGRSLAKRLWQECAAILNSISSDCVQKTGEQWRMFYNEYKHRLLKKIKRDKIERAATGGGPPTLIILTPLQERLYDILGRDVGEPLPGVRHNPIAQIENEGGIVAHSSMNVVHSELVMNDCSGFGQMDFDPHPEPSGSQVGPSNRGEPETTLQTPLRESLEPQPQSRVQINSRQPAPRRRRRRLREEITESSLENFNEDASLRRATASLETLEHASAQATQEHARATNRLAAALETLADRLKDPIKITLEQAQEVLRVPCRKKSRICYSDSE